MREPILQQFFPALHECPFMAAGRRTQKPSKKVPFEEISELLFSAIKNGDDFVLTREPHFGEEPGTEPVIHILTGNLITPCRLNGIMGRAALCEDEGARIVTFREKDLVSGREK
jgi:hypothetical protein